MYTINGIFKNKIIIEKMNDTKTDVTEVAKTVHKSIVFIIESVVINNGFISTNLIKNKLLKIKQLCDQLIKVNINNKSEINILADNIKNNIDIVLKSQIAIDENLKKIFLNNLNSLYDLMNDTTSKCLSSIKPDNLQSKIEYYEYVKNSIKNQSLNKLVKKVKEITT